MPRVLIVDDQEVYRRHLSQILAGEGHEVQAAPSGHEAIELGTAFRPHVLIADCRLTDDTDGLHVVEAVRSANADLQAIMTTGFLAPELEKQARLAGISRIIEKPFSLDEMIHAVRDALHCHP